MKPLRMRRKRDIVDGHDRRDPQAKGRCIGRGKKQIEVIGRRGPWQADLLPPGIRGTRNNSGGGVIQAEDGGHRLGRVKQQLVALRRVCCPPLKEAQEIAARPGRTPTKLPCVDAYAHSRRSIAAR